MPGSNQKSDPRALLLKYAVNILSRRPYFRHTLKHKLLLYVQNKNRHCEERSDVAIQDYRPIIDNILDDLAQSGYLDDQYLAEAYVRRQLSKCYGPRLISLKLGALHLDRQSILSALKSEATPENQIENIKRFYAKHSRMDKSKVVSKLYSRGFDGQLINKLFDGTAIED